MSHGSHVQVEEGVRRAALGPMQLASIGFPRNGSQVGGDVVLDDC